MLGTHLACSKHNHIQSRPSSSMRSVSFRVPIMSSNSQDHEPALLSRERDSGQQHEEKSTTKYKDANANTNAFDYGDDVNASSSSWSSAEDTEALSPTLDGDESNVRTDKKSASLLLARWKGLNTRRQRLATQHAALVKLHPGAPNFCVIIRYSNPHLTPARLPRHHMPSPLPRGSHKHLSSRCQQVSRDGGTGRHHRQGACQTSEISRPMSVAVGPDASPLICIVRHMMLLSHVSSARSPTTRLQPPPFEQERVVLARVAEQCRQKIRKASTK